MKEMFRSKVLVGFIVFVLGFTYVNSVQMSKLNYEEETSNEVLYISQKGLEEAI